MRMKKERDAMNFTIGEKIKKLRTQKNVTQEKLAESLGVTPQAISRWESGAGYPAIDYLPDLAAFFEISVDELLGVKLSKREARREEIYAQIKRIEDENGFNNDPGAVDMLREAHAEFPGDTKISFALARELCYERYEKNPDQAVLREAEKILRNLMRQADDYDFKFKCAKTLAVLYREAWQDEQGYEEVTNMLPKISSCKEIFISDLFTGTHQKKEDVDAAILTLTCMTLWTLRDYVAFELPNEAETWDEKLRLFEGLIGFCKLISNIIGDAATADMASNIAVLYRYMATYHIAADRTDETLTCLETALDHYERVCALPQKEAVEHNFAWYFSFYLKQDRYDPIREDPRFVAIEEKMKALAK